MKNNKEKAELFKKAEVFLMSIIRIKIVKEFEEQENFKCAWRLPVYKEAPSGRCPNDIIPEDIRGDIINVINNSIFIFIRNKYSIKDCSTYAVELLDLHYYIKITITKIENLPEILLQKKGFDKFKDGCYVINQDDLKRKINKGK